MSTGQVRKTNSISSKHDHFIALSGSLDGALSK